jgi:putative DNA primase/helicase
VSTATSNGHVSRFTSSDPCPVCGGSDHDPRGQSRRCHGYISTDGKFIFCARDEHAGKAHHDDGSNCYRHIRKGPCPCGKEHAPADPKTSSNGRGEIDKVYRYYSADGAVLFEVVRKKNPKGFSQRRPLGNGKYQYKNVFAEISPVLYKLPQIATAEAESTIWFVEGEKDVDRLGSLGELATCNPMGAGKWRKEYAETLRGFHVAIIPDNDHVGREHAQQVAQSLHGKAASVRVVELPGLPDKGDVSDFLAAGGTLERLWDLAGKTPEWTPSAPPAPEAKPAEASAEIKVNEAVDDPHRLARIYRDQHCRHDDGMTLRFYCGEYIRWDGSAYRNQPAKEVNAYLNRTCKAEFDRANREDIKAWADRGKVDRKGDECPPPQARKVGSRLIGDTSLALASMALLEASAKAPSWLAGDPPFEDPVEIIPCRNALVHIPSLVAGNPAILEPTPLFFNTYSLDFSFDADAPRPSLWLDFMLKLWEKDQQSIDTLQEWFGYCLTPDTSQQKILSMFGPKRSGRGTIARVLTALIGAENVAGPTLNSLTTNFGVATLIGKPLAIISDARMSGRTDQAVVVERLLSISGEDTLDIDRKHVDPWTGKLPTRLVLISNELPQLKDASGALPGRMVLLRLTKSFFGKEDRTLTDKLMAELPGILLWAIEGWRRLRERGHFVQPESGADMVKQMEDIASPVGAFLQEQYQVKPGLQTDVETIFAAWCRWCESKNRKPGSEGTFGRDIRTIMPWLETKRRRGGPGEKPFIRYYEGLGAKIDGEEPAF